MRETSETTAIGLDALAERAGNAGATGAPVHLWDPPFCGTIDMKIAADGRWFHQGRAITREPLVRLFASILKVEDDGETYLVTPVEKLRMTVEDAHFVAVEVVRHVIDGQTVLKFRTNVGDVVEADRDHPLALPKAIEADFCPYLTVRGGLRAKASRSVALDLAEWLAEDEAGLYLISRGARFQGPKGAFADE